MRKPDIEHPQLSLAVNILRDNLLFMAGAECSVPERIKAAWQGWRSGTGMAIHELEAMALPETIATQFAGVAALLKLQIEVKGTIEKIGPHAAKEIVAGLAHLYRLSIEALAGEEAVAAARSRTATASSLPET
jgi:hypothetical protein